MNDISDDNTVFSTPTPRISKLKFVLKNNIHYQRQIFVLPDLNDGKVVENAVLSSDVSFIPSSDSVV